MNTLFEQNQPFTLEDQYSPSANVVLFPGDCSTLLASMPSGVVDLVITSPPYNVGKEYEKSKPLAHYLDEQEGAIRELHRVLVDTGRIAHA